MPERLPLEVLKTRIHVGCGPKALKFDWLNVDIRSFPGVDHVCDITQPWDGLSDVQYVYGEHFLEHLAIDQALAFMRFARKAMVEGGRIRLSTPALEWVLSTHFDTKTTDAARMCKQTFAMNRAFHGWGHQFLWSRAMLDAALHAAGFRNINFVAYGESEDPQLRGIEEHGGYKIEHGFPSVWIVEGMKVDDAVEDQSFFDTVDREFSRYVRSGH